MMVGRMGWDVWREWKGGVELVGEVREGRVRGGEVVVWCLRPTEETDEETIEENKTPFCELLPGNVFLLPTTSSAQTTKNQIECRPGYVRPCASSPPSNIPTYRPSY